MNFKEGHPIFVQIAERLGDEIVSRTYRPESRVPGVREYAALLEVNVNTVVKHTNSLRGKASSTLSAAWATTWPPMPPNLCAASAATISANTPFLRSSAKCASWALAWTKWCRLMRMKADSLPNQHNYLQPWMSD